MFDKFGVDGLHDSGYEVAEGYLAVRDHREFLFQPLYCWLMVESIDLRLVREMGWRKQHQSGPVDNYIHDASQRGCIRQRQEHGV
jgi:hypothetical protein